MVNVVGLQLLMIFHAFPLSRPSLFSLSLSLSLSHTHKHSFLPTLDTTSIELPALPRFNSNTTMPSRVPTSATMPSDTGNTTTITTTSKSSRIGTIEQPHSRLHALPPEIRDMIYELAVVSPDHIPVNIAAVPTLNPPAPVPSRFAQARRGSGRGFTTKKPFRPLHRNPQRPTSHNFLCYQPPLACIDRSTRTEVLRIYFQRNTFLFRVTSPVSKPLQTWLDATAPRGVGSGSSGDDGNDDGYDYAGGAARLIERVAIEREVPKTCVVQRVEDRSQIEGEVHTWRIVVGVESMKKVQKKKDGDGEPGEELQPRTQTSSSSSSSSNTNPSSQRPILTVHHEADLVPICACTFRAAASLSPYPGGAFRRPRPPFSPRAAEVLSFAREVEDQAFRDLAGDCGMLGVCLDGQRRRARRRRVCGVCGGNVSGTQRLFGVGERLMPWYEMVAKEEGRL